MSHKYVALETTGFVRKLIEVSAHYCQLHNTGQVDGVPARHQQFLVHQPLVPFDKHTAWDWLVATVVLIVNSRLMYQHNPFDANIAKTMFAADGTYHPTMKFYADDFLSVDEVDSIVLDLHNTIDRYVGFNTWMEWTVTTNGNCVALVSGQDHRVTQWELLTHYRGEDHVLELDFTNVVSYLRSQMNRTLKPLWVELNGEKKKVLPGNMINFRPILQEAITHCFPKITFPTELNLTGLGTEVAATFQPIDIDFPKLSKAGITDYAMFRDHYVIPVIKTFGFVHFARRLDETDDYIATLDGSYVLVLDYADASQWRKVPNEQAHLEELAESLTRGDYLPESDRRKAEEYILSNRQKFTD